MDENSKSIQSIFDMVDLFYTMKRFHDRLQEERLSHEDQKS